MSVTLAAEKEDFLRAHSEEIYEAVTDGLTRFVRLDELVYEAAERHPDVLPTREDMAVERQCKLADKEGLELAQGLFLAHVLSSPRTRSHLVHAMLRPPLEAPQRPDDFCFPRVAGPGRPAPA